MDGGARRRARLGVVPVMGLGVLAQAERAGATAERNLNWAVWGLLGLAALIAVATVWFWRATRPDPAPDPEVAMRWVPSDAPAPVSTTPRAPRPGRVAAPPTAPPADPGAAVGPAPRAAAPPRGPAPASPRRDPGAAQGRAGGSGARDAAGPQGPPVSRRSRMRMDLGLGAGPSADAG